MIEKAGPEDRRPAHDCSCRDAQAEGFYAVHKERPFFGDLVKFMTSGPCVVMASRARTPSRRYREVMGATDSKKAPAGTIRKRFGTNIERNAVHGSDAAGHGQGRDLLLLRGLGPGVVMRGGGVRAFILTAN